MPRIAKQQRIRLAQLLIYALHDNQRIISSLGELGIDAERAAAQGEQLQAVANDAINQQIVQKGRFSELLWQMRGAHAALWASFSEHYDLAEVKIKARALRSYLGLNAPLPKGRPKQQALIDMFYRHALDRAEARAILETLSITGADLEAGHAALRAIQALSRKIITAGAERQRATKAQNAALDALDSWRRRLYTCIDLVTEKDPAVRKALGRRRAS